MAKTKISDIIVPEIWAPYVIRRSMELSALFQSGIITDIGNEIGTGLTAGGNTINMPYFADLSGDDEVLSDSAALEVDKISARKDVAVVHFRGKAWSVNDLARQLSGADPMQAITDLAATYWNRKMQTILLKTLAGALGAAASNVKDITDTSTTPSSAQAPTGINAATFIDACQLLGDAQSQVVAVAMHSAVRSQLAKNDLIETIRDSEGRTVMETFMGKRVICDDGMPYDSSTQNYTTYIFGAGAVGYSEGGVLDAVETDRDSLAGDDVLINRRCFVLHPRGIKWKGTASGASPTNTELQTTSNWEKVYDTKQIPIIAFKHKLVNVAGTGA